MHGQSWLVCRAQKESTAHQVCLAQPFDVGGFEGGIIFRKVQVTLVQVLSICLDLVVNSLKIEQMGPAQMRGHQKVQRCKEQQRL